MFKSKLLTPIVIAGALFLSACGAKWETAYPDDINPDVSKGWRVVAVDVQVPQSLSVSEANTYAPDADIVWREDPYGKGTRYQQVDAIITEAAKRGAKVLRGGKPVKLVIVMQQFHALSEKARYGLSNAGVHNIVFTAQVFDARTGKPLTNPDLIKSDLVAYVGEQAIDAEQKGLTQKVRIIDHVSKVIQGWLSHTVDVRGKFSRSGR